MGERSVTEPIKIVRYDTDAKHIPSYESMGFRTKIANAFPYHPMPDLYLNHFEIEFASYKVSVLDNRIPSFEEVLRRYWRNRLIIFLRREYKALGIPLPTVHRKEEEFFVNRPQMWTKWQNQKAKHLLVQRKKWRFSGRGHSFGRCLQFQWIVGRKVEFILRSLGARAQQKDQCLDAYANLILGCWHWDCWMIRIQYFPQHLYMWLKFVYSRRTNPGIVNIH